MALPQNHAHYQYSPPYFSTALPSPLLPSRTGSPILIDSRPEGSLINHARLWKSTNCRRSLVDTLPDDVLLEIFDFCAPENKRTKKAIETWQILVHVCRRWRTVVFGSPRRLNLRLVCTNRTPARDLLDVWPALPLVVRCYGKPVETVDNIVAVLERINRVCRIELQNVPSSDLEKVSAAMQVPFPKLTRLWLLSKEKTAAVLPDSFLGASAPRLRALWLRGILFPGLPKLLLSATYLVDLRLHNIPHSGYIPPEAMVAVLFMLTSLESLRLEFESPRSRPNPASRHPPPPTRFILPVLMDSLLKGTSEYLEDLVARIDAPRLNGLKIIFFNQIVFDTPQLIQFINRTPKLKLFEEARVVFSNDAARVVLTPTSRRLNARGQELSVMIPCGELDWQVSSMEQICTWCLPPLSTLEKLYIYGYPWSETDRRWKDNIENTLWLELLQPFTTVKDLYLCKEVAPRIVPALQELVGHRTMEVLPALQNVFLEGQTLPGPVQEGIRLFVATRQASHPIAVSRWVGGGKRYSY